MSWVCGTCNSSSTFFNYNMYDIIHPSKSISQTWFNWCTFGRLCENVGPGPGSHRWSTHQWDQHHVWTSGRACTTSPAYPTHATHAHNVHSLQGPRDTIPEPSSCASTSVGRNDELWILHPEEKNDNKEMRKMKMRQNSRTHTHTHPHSSLKWSCWNANLSTCFSAKLSHHSGKGQNWRKPKLILHQNLHLWH